MVPGVVRAGGEPHVAGPVTEVVVEAVERELRPRPGTYIGLEGLEAVEPAGETVRPLPP